MTDEVNEPASEPAPGPEPVDAVHLEPPPVGTGPVIAFGVEHPFPEIAVTVGRMAAMTTVAVVLALSGTILGILWLAGLHGTPLAAASLALALFAVAAGTWAWRWPRRAWSHRSWRLDAEAVRVRDGVYWQREVSVPRSRVQHVDVAEGPFQRLHGLATLVIHTAGTETAQVAVRSLPREVAIRLRDALVRAAHDDAV